MAYTNRNNDNRTRYNSDYSNRYPSEIIDDIRSGNDIVELVSAYVQLKQKGSSLFGLCPFHKEKSPSFSVLPDRQIFHCFGCGASGNVISFLMQMENLGFLEAIRSLAERIHYVLPPLGSSDLSKEKERANEREQLTAIHVFAAKLYYENLNGNIGEECRRYLDERGLSNGVRKKFGLGYSANSFEHLYRSLISQGFDISLIEKSGLAISNKKGGYFDRFNNRLMFPIFDVMGKIIGFGGRILPDIEKETKVGAKYLNSPETPLFEKSKCLYGLNFARLSKRREFIVVEGYMDVLSLYQAGFHNVIASMGTAFNAEHAKQIKKYADSVILVFDSDEAGTKAAQRAIPVLTESGLRVKILQVMDAKDPDEYIKKFGAESFASLLLKALHHVAFSIHCIRSKYDINQTDQKVLFVTETAELLTKLDNAIERDAYIRDIAENSNISEESIRTEINSRIKRDANQLKPYASIFTNRAVKKDDGLIKAIKNIINILFYEPELRKKIMPYLSPDEMCDILYGNLLSDVYDLDKSNAIPADFISRYDDIDEQKTAAGILFEQYILTNETGEKVLNDIIKKIKDAFISAKMLESDSDELKNLMIERKNLQNLYISMADG